MASHDPNQGPVHSSGDLQHRSVSPASHGQQYHDPNGGLTVDPSLGAYPTGPSFHNPDGGVGVESYEYSPYSGLSPTGLPRTETLSPPADPGYAPAMNTNNHPISQSFEATLARQLEHSNGLQHIQEGNFTEMFNSNQPDFSLYQGHSPNAPASDYDSSQLLDPQMISPVDLVSPISNPASSHPSQDPQHSSPGHMSPPASTPGTYYTPQHSRHTSLDPSTAYYNPHPNPDWQSVMNNVSFQSHRRAPSEVSEVSSANHSPYLSQHEIDGIENNASPALLPQNDPTLYENGLGMESFTLSDTQHGISPLQTPYISPRLMPQQSGEVVPSASYLSPFPAAPVDTYGITQEEMNIDQPNNVLGDIGQASQMAPPSINVEFAPPLRNQNLDLSRSTADFDSLSPPAMRKLSMVTPI